MDKPRPCGCKGKRTCLSCEGEYGLEHNDISDIQEHLSGVKTCVPPFPSRRQSYQSYHDKTPEERISYCTGPLETRAEFEFSDDNYSENNSDITSNIPSSRGNPASCRSVTRLISSSCNISRDSEQSHKSQKENQEYISKHLSSPHASEYEAKVGSRGEFHSTTQPQLSRYHLRQSNKHEILSSRHRRPFNKSNFDTVTEKTDTSEVEIDSPQKLHRSHRPKTATGFQTAPITRPKRHIERVGLHVSINDCVCIASSADLGTATDSKTNLTNKNKRHVFTWASRTPADVNESRTQPSSQHPESGSGTQVDILSSLQQPEGCNCTCQPQTQPQSAADYYHMMQGRQTEFGGRDREQGQDERGGRDGVGGASVMYGAGGLHTGGAGPGGYAVGGSGAYGAEGYGAGGYGTDAYGTGPYGLGAYSPGGYNAGAGGIGTGETMTGSRRGKKDGAYPSTSRKRHKGSLRDWQDPHKLYPDPLAWGGERPYRWEDNLRTTGTNALIAVHPQRWMPVGKQQYSHHHAYPSWPDAITNMLMPWSNPVCCDLPQPHQTLICWPGGQSDSTPACCPNDLRNCYCDSNGVRDSSHPRQTCAC